ncbi:hypothetical protein HYW74_04670 [Candidatus Pacearchaeota archaeon]|nr:hypothetical protein [Candidatus Pacearchaeota archaeon]
MAEEREYTPEQLALREEMITYLESDEGKKRYGKASRKSNELHQALGNARRPISLERLSKPMDI